MLNTRKLKPGDFIHLTFKTEVRRIYEDTFSTQYNSFVHNQKDIVSIEVLPKPFAVGDSVYWATKDQTFKVYGKINAVGSAYALVVVDETTNDEQAFLLADLHHA